MKTPNREAMEVAVKSLMAGLDRTPRDNWPQVMEMALEAMKQMGYAEGYRVGSSLAPKFAEGPAMDAVPIMAAAHAELREDRALVHEVRTADEIAEDRGYEFIRAISRQIGHLAMKHDVTAGSAHVYLAPIMEGENGKTGLLNIRIHNLTVKG